MILRIGLLFTGKYFTGVTEVLEIKRATNELEVKCKPSEASDDWWFETWDLGVVERGFKSGDYFISKSLAERNDLNDPIMKPSLFLERPWNSILSKSESETIAHNIMAILARTGDKFRELSWDEYETERRKDGNFSDKEKGYFDQTIYLAKGSVKEVTAFCQAWKSAYRKTEFLIEKQKA